MERWRATTKHYETSVDKTNTKTEGCIVRVGGCGRSTNIQRMLKTNGQIGWKKMNGEQSKFPVKRRYPTLEARNIRKRGMRETMRKRNENRGTCMIAGIEEYLVVTILQVL